MSGHTPSERAEDAPNEVQREILRIQRLFVPSQGDKEDILSYALRVVGMERERDEAITNSHDRIAELNAEAAANEAKIEALVGALVNVRKIISDGALTGFNCKDGDWADRLFQSQQMTSEALKEAALTSAGEK